MILVLEKQQYDKCSASCFGRSGNQLGNIWFTQNFLLNQNVELQMF
jgi:hypothetical protein